MVSERERGGKINQKPELREGCGVHSTQPVSHCVWVNDFHTSFILSIVVSFLIVVLD